MSKPKRHLSEANIYHVVLKGNGGQIIFESPTDRQCFLKTLSSSLNKHNGKSLSWCLLDNHVHLLLRMPIEAISNAMMVLCSTYTKTFNKKYNRTGALFHAPFFSEPINGESHLLQAIRYIHQNPIEANVTTDLANQWSSFKYYLNSSECPLPLEKNYVIEIFGSIEAFVRFHEAHDSNRVLHEPNGENLSQLESCMMLANDVLGEGVLHNVKAMSYEDRNSAIRALQKTGLTIREIELLTGIPKSIVGRICKK